MPPVILAEEAAWSNPDRRIRNRSPTPILAEEAAWSNPDMFLTDADAADILAEEAAWSNKGASDGNRAGRIMSRRRVSGGYLLVAIKRWISGWTIDLWRFLNFFRNSDGGMPNWASKARENAAG